MLLAETAAVEFDNYNAPAGSVEMGQKCGERDERRPVSATLPVSLSPSAILTSHLEQKVS